MTRLFAHLGITSGDSSPSPEPRHITDEVNSRMTSWVGAGAIDIDADGRLDFYDSDDEAHLGTRNWPFLLVSVYKPAGLATTFTYASSADTNGGFRSPVNMFQPRIVVDEVRTHDLVTGKVARSLYTFTSGVQNRDLFLGFEKTRVVHQSTFWNDFWRADLEAFTELDLSTPELGPLVVEHVEHIDTQHCDIPALAPLDFTQCTADFSKPIRSFAIEWQSLGRHGQLRLPTAYWSETTMTTVRAALPILARPPSATTRTGC